MSLAIGVTPVMGGTMCLDRKVTGLLANGNDCISRAPFHVKHAQSR